MKKMKYIFTFLLAACFLVSCDDLSMNETIALHAARQKLTIHLATADHPRNGLIGNHGERFVDAMHHVDALGSKALVTREHDIAAVLERTPTGKTQQGLASHNNRAPFGARHKMAHVGAIGHHHVALAPNAPVIAHGDNGRKLTRHARHLHRNGDVLDLRVDVSVLKSAYAKRKDLGHYSSYGLFKFFRERVHIPLTILDCSVLFNFCPHIYSSCMR